MEFLASGGHAFRMSTIRPAGFDIGESTCRNCSMSKEFSSELPGPPEDSSTACQGDCCSMGSSSEGQLSRLAKGLSSCL